MSISEPSARRNWVGVTADQPCEICGRPDWCARTADTALAVCRRSASSDRHGPGRRREDKSGGVYWFYRLRPDVASPKSTHRPAPGVGRADADTLHHVYTHFLGALALRYAHRHALRVRGLTDEDIDARGYRTLDRCRAEAVRAVIAKGEEGLLSGVPGFVLRSPEGQPPPLGLRRPRRPPDPAPGRAWPGRRPDRAPRRGRRCRSGHGRRQVPLRLQPEIRRRQTQP